MHRNQVKTERFLQMFSLQVCQSTGFEDELQQPAKSRKVIQLYFEKIDRQKLRCICSRKTQINQISLLLIDYYYAKPTKLISEYLKQSLLKSSLKFNLPIKLSKLNIIKDLIRIFSSRIKSTVVSQTCFRTSRKRKNIFYQKIA